MYKRQGPAGPQGIQGPKGAVEPGEVVPLPSGELIPNSRESVKADWSLSWNGGVVTLCINSLSISESGNWGLLSPVGAVPSNLAPKKDVGFILSTTTDDDFGVVNIRNSGTLSWSGLSTGKTYRGSASWAISGEVSAMSGPAGPAGPQGPPGPAGSGGAGQVERMTLGTSGAYALKQGSVVSIVGAGGILNGKLPVGWRPAENILLASARSATSTEITVVLVMNNGEVRSEYGATGAVTFIAEN